MRLFQAKKVAARARPPEARAQNDVSGVLNHAHDPARKEKRCRGDPPDALRPTDTYLPPRTTNAEREEFTNGLRGVDRERSRCQFELQHMATSGRGRAP